MAYTCLRNAWMTSEIFEYCIRDLDQHMITLLVVDSCPRHSQVKSLSAVELFFLPLGALNVILGGL